MDKRQVSFVEVFRFVWAYWARLPWRFTAIVVGALTAIVLEVQIPALSAGLVVAVKQAIYGEAGIDAAWSALFGLVAIFALVSLVQQGYLRVWMYFATKVMHALVTDGFYRVQRFSADWHANNFAGATVRKISRGMWAYDDFADTLVMDLGPGFALLIGFSIAMFMRDPFMGAYFAIAVTVFVTASIVMSLLYVGPANQLSNDADTHLGGALADAVTCNVIIKSFGAEQREDRALRDTAWRWRTAASRAWIRSMNAGAVQSLLIVLLMAGLLSIVVANAARGDAKLEDIVYVITTYFLVNGYLRNIGWQVRNLQRALNELDDLVAISKTTPQVANHPHAQGFVEGRGRIQFQRVGFKYQNQPEAVFDNLNVEIEPGERVALVGESGSGKTTFVKLVQRLYDVQAGRIVVDGQDVRNVTQESLRRSIALVPQEPILFHRSLRENIAYGRPDASFEEIVDAAKKAHADEFISRLQAGFDTLVGERGIKLSGGERQRVAIARAILADAPILILDEATSSLDSITEHLIQDAMANLMQNRTAVLIAHRLSTVREANRILVFDAGMIVEEGNHDSLMSNTDGIYRRLFDMQMLGFVDESAAG